MFSGARSLALASLAALFLMSSGPLARAASPTSAELWNGPAINWRTIGDGIRESTRTGKTVIMVFHAKWCTSCKRYREVWKDPAVVEASKDFVMILIDVDEHPDENGAFSPDGTYVPRTIFLNPEGDVLSQYRGRDPEFPHSLDIASSDELLSIMKKAASDGPQTPGAKPQESETHPDQRASNE